MSAPPSNPVINGIPAIDVVVLQHFAQMVDEYYPRALRAEEVAGAAQHQVHVLLRHVDAITAALEAANARIAHMDAFILQSTTFAQAVIAAIPDIDNDDDRVIEYNRMIYEYNRNNPIDLTTDDDLE